MAYSRCAAQPGWNLKYKKGSTALCTLYPMPGFFIALIVLREKDFPEVEGILPLCSAYTQALYARTAVCMKSKWLMMTVKEADVLKDVQQLIAFKCPPKKLVPADI